MTPHGILDAYAALVGLPELRVDAEGCARLVFERQSIVVDLEVDAHAGFIHLYSVLGPVSSGLGKAFYRALLEANFFGEATRGASLCMDPTREEVLIYRRFACHNGTVEEFCMVIRDFATATGQWREACAEPRKLLS